MSIINAQLSAVAVAFIMLMTVPTIAGIDMNSSEIGSDIQSDDRTWTSEIPLQTPKPAPTTQPWWERTSRDSNRNSIVDSLESLTDDTEEPLIISYSRKITPTDLDSLAELGIEGGYIVKSIDAISVGLRPISIIPQLTNLDGVVMIERSGMVHLYSDVATRNLKARGSEEYSPYSAWEQFNYTGYGINVAVTDTGIDDMHPSLEYKQVAGYDAVAPESNEDGTTDPDDRNGHGTSCSGMATGTSKGDPDLAYMGSAPGATLVDVQIGTDIGAGPFENYLLPTTYYDSALRGMEWVRDNADTEWSWVEEEHYGIDIQSLSWGITSHEDGGSDGSDPFSRLIDEIVEEGVVCVGAAGNDGPNNDGFSGMSATSEGIVVGATDDLNTVTRDDDIIAGYSSRGPRRDDGDGYPYDELKPDVSAPGTSIWNTEPCVDSNLCYGDAEGNGYENRGSGTSYATPAAAGVVALMMEANPELEPAHIKQILHMTSERRGEATLPDIDPFWNRDFGYGIVDAYEAVKVSVELQGQDLRSLDVELQAYIVNITETKKGAVIEGLAWAKVDEVEMIEVSIDGKDWVEVEYAEDTYGTGEFIDWRYEVKKSKLGFTGNHTVHVRAVNGNDHSIPHSEDFYAKGSSGSGEDDGDGLLGLGSGSDSILGLLIGVVILVGVFYFVYKKPKKTTQNGQ